MKKFRSLKLTTLLSFILVFAFVLGTATGCQSSDSSSDAADEEASVSEESAESGDDVVVLKGIVDLTPHSELIEFVEDKLKEEGVEIELVSTASDATTNEKLNSGEIDFNFFQHEPYLIDECETNGYDLVSAGAIHVEPITAYSDKYESVDEIPDGATVAIPNNGTNEIRALNILEEQGFITLDDSVDGALTATVADVKEYNKDIEIIEIDSDQIIPTKADYDFFVVNTNKALEANITSTKLFAESAENNPYANIIAVRSEDKDNPAIKKLVEALQSEETRQYIEDTYNGAVIPVEEE